MSQTIYQLKIAQAWAAYNRKHPFISFYAFASAYNAGWADSEADSL